MKKEYRLDIDITLSANLYIEAESEEQAKEIAMVKIKSDANYYAQKGAFVNAEIFEIEEQ